MSTNNTSLSEMILSKVDSSDLSTSRNKIGEDYKKVYKKATDLKLLDDKSEKGLMIKNFLQLSRKCIFWIDTAKQLKLGESDESKWKLMMLKVKLSKNE